MGHVPYKVHILQKLSMIEMVDIINLVDLAGNDRRFQAQQMTPAFRETRHGSK
jgi:hypothetical protein